MPLPAIYLVLLLGVLVMGSCDYYVIDPHDHRVGHIETRNRNEPGPCYPENIFPSFYGRKAAGFGHGKDSLATYMIEQYKSYGNKTENGYLTVRFIINCIGEAGQFEIEQLGTDYRPKSFNRKTVTRIVEALKALEDWEPITFFDDSYDSYFHITFKIKNGEIAAVLP